jgi:hypothetical protein
MKFLMAVSLVAGARMSVGATLHVDTFDADAQGWGGGGGAVYTPTGGAGDGGGFILVYPGVHLATFNSGATWIGNYQSIGAARIKVDMMAPSTSASPLAIRLVLFGPTTTSERWSSSVAQTVPNDGVWRNYIFNISATDLVHVQGLSTYPQMIAGVVRAMFRHEPNGPQSGGDDVFDVQLGLDNIELATAPPTPGDFDNDGDVDGNDLNGQPLGFRSRFGADLFGNDFLTWQRNLNVPVSQAAGQSAPEPGAIRLMMMAAAIVLGQWTRRRERRR